MSKATPQDLAARIEHELMRGPDICFRIFGMRESDASSFLEGLELKETRVDRFSLESFHSGLLVKVWLTEGASSSRALGVYATISQLLRSLGINVEPGEG